MNDVKIVAIGGGTGLSILLRGLKLFSEEITAIVNVVDDGGGSGVLREDLAMLPPGDIRNCILGLASKEPVLQELFAYRFDEGRYKNQSFGNLMIAAMLGISENFEDAISKISDIFAVQGQVLPATNEDVHLVAELEDGTIVRGESKIPYQVLKKRSPIKKVFLKPLEVTALSRSIKAIEEADIIFVGPGSLYTSLIPNLLVTGISEAIVASSAKKIYLSNLMTQPGETDDFSIADHVKAIYEHSEVRFDFIVANNEEVSKEVKERYLKEASKMLMLNRKDRQYFSDQNMKVVESNFIEVRQGYVRHDIEKIVEFMNDHINKGL
ncbi:YvcK family protein [Acidaminobacter sp. JC074]|uniref:gluconeogenesis factor YvcK family protein n=1 Tax=Acidaminobacter sp. JC074 TaxID=2530199 RepID=UPI001F0FCD22|nr:uridine diphosphate-N-acetylglucosamine-binding protein YvcK [Acidaminobacter sp. JC074]MCH4888983.1 YvcK family protein [Acidaminobacter sp. JC074]